jgi:hypothetical protein
MNQQRSVKQLGHERRMTVPQEGDTCQRNSAGIRNKVDLEPQQPPGKQRDARHQSQFPFNANLFHFFDPERCDMGHGSWNAEQTLGTYWTKKVLLVNDCASVQASNGTPTNRATCRTTTVARRARAYWRRWKGFGVPFYGDGALELDQADPVASGQCGRLATG